MDIEQLSKSQTVLLTLLVSFVTSIATGIVTVSLMDQAPPAIAQTVNRVIERTVETVVQSDQKGQTASTIVTQEKTVVVKEADLVAQAVQRINPSLVRIYTSESEDARFLGLGIVLDNRGTVLIDSSALEGGDAMVVLSDGTRARAFVTKRDSENSLAYLKAATSTEPAPAWIPATIASDRIVLGDSVVSLSGKSVTRIATGVVTEMPQSAVIDTNIPADSILSGSPLINTDGNVVGISTAVSRASSPSGFLTSTILLAPASPAEPAKK